MTNAERYEDGTLKQVPIHRLRLDAHNPRLAEKARTEGQVELAHRMALRADVLSVAQSMVDFGYFIAEPLLVIPSGDPDESLTVVEGNRRLTALLGLVHRHIRQDFERADAWEKLAQASNMSEETLIPVVEFRDREFTHFQVARAHVKGKLDWPPYAQALYIAARVHEGKSWDEVAHIVGLSKAAVTKQYRDQAVLKQAADLGVDTSSIAEHTFTSLTVALGIGTLREHCGVPVGSLLKPGEDPVPEDKTDEFLELLGWLFGTPQHEPVVPETRFYAKLGKVVGSEVGLASLRANRDLDKALAEVESAGMEPHKRLLKRLTTARNSLAAASDDFGEFIDDSEVLEVLEEIEAALEDLQTVRDQQNYD